MKPVKPTTQIQTLCSPIDWKESFFFQGVVIKSHLPFKCHFCIRKISDDGKTLTIIPGFNTKLDHFLFVLQGCLDKGSNFRKVSQEYLGKRAYTFMRFEFDWYGITVTFDNEMTAWDGKLQFLRKALHSGYEGVPFLMSPEEIKALSDESPELKEKIILWRSQA